MNRRASSVLAAAALAVASLCACDAQPVEASASSSSPAPSTSASAHSADVGDVTIQVACDGTNELITSNSGWASTFAVDLDVSAHSANCAYAPYLAASKPNAVATITVGDVDVSRRCLGTEMLYSIGSWRGDSAFAATQIVSGDPRCVHNAPTTTLN